MTTEENNKEMGEHWAQLVSVTDNDSADVPIYKDKFTIGRSSDADLPHVGNKLVSGSHCYIERDDTGKVWLFDTSTNGTLLNMSIKLSKGECRELHHGDEIYIVYKKNNTDNNLGYVFQDMAALKAEETSSDLEETQDYTQDADLLEATLNDDNVNAVDTFAESNRKRKAKGGDEISEKRSKPNTTSETDSAEITEPPDAIGGSHAKEKGDLKVEQSKEGRPVEESSKAEEPSAATTAVPKESDQDAIAESLICIICQELLHDCVSLQPCMHSFCAGCYSEWMEKSNKCPSCRLKVDRINKNHIVNNLVEAYLKEKPAMQRPEEDIKELDAKNKITREMLYPKKKARNNDSDDDEEYSEEEEEEEEDDDVSAPLPGLNQVHQGGGLLCGIGTPMFGVRPARTVCRQCPDENRPAGILAGVQQALTAVRNLVAPGAGPAGQPVPHGAGPSTADAPLDVDAKRFPTPPPYTCHPTGNHALCLCCMQPMPDRRHQYLAGMDIPPQQCAICYRVYCHAYWGCQKADCSGCLDLFKNLNFGKKVLTSLILENPYETEIFKNYLEQKGISVREVLADCLAKLVQGTYVVTDNARLTKGINTPLCYTCGLRSFKELAYCYRKEIPQDQLPKTVTSRPNCYWGKNCRTQRNKPEHAQRFNHICEQTRTL